MMTQTLLEQLSAGQKYAIDDITLLGQIIESADSSQLAVFIPCDETMFLTNGEHHLRITIQIEVMD